MRRVLPESVLEEVGKLDPAAIEQVRKEAWPDVRDADELHDVLHTLVALPVDHIPLSDRKTASHMGPGALNLPAELGLEVGELRLAGPGMDFRDDPDRPGTDHLHSPWQPWFDWLKSAGRGVRAFRRDKQYWIAAERAKAFRLLFP